jgi:hypothetical protein
MRSHTHDLIAFSDLQPDLGATPRSPPPVLPAGNRKCLMSSIGNRPGQGAELLQAGRGQSNRGEMARHRRFTQSLRLERAMRIAGSKKAPSQEAGLGSVGQHDGVGRHDVAAAQASRHLKHRPIGTGYQCQFVAR